MARATIVQYAHSIWMLGPERIMYETIEIEMGEREKNSSKICPVHFSVFAPRDSADGDGTYVRVRKCVSFLIRNARVPTRYVSISHRHI